MTSSLAVLCREGLGDLGRYSADAPEASSIPAFTTRLSGPSWHTSMLANRCVCGRSDVHTRAWIHSRPAACSSGLQERLHRSHLTYDGSQPPEEFVNAVLPFPREPEPPRGRRPYRRCWVSGRWHVGRGSLL